MENCGGFVNLSVLVKVAAHTMALDVLFYSIVDKIVYGELMLSKQLI